MKLVNQHYHDVAITSACNALNFSCTDSIRVECLAAIESTFLNFFTAIDSLT